MGHMVWSGIIFKELKRIPAAFTTLVPFISNSGPIYLKLLKNAIHLWFAVVWWLCRKVVHWRELLPHFNFEVQYSCSCSLFFPICIVVFKTSPLRHSYSSNPQSWFQLSGKSVWLKNRTQCNATISTFPFKCNKRILATRLGNLWRVIIVWSYFLLIFLPIMATSRFFCKTRNANEYISCKIFLQSSKCTSIYWKTWMGDTSDLFLCSGVGWLYQKIQDIQVVKFFVLLLFQLQYWWSPGEPCVFSGLWRIVAQAKIFSEGLGGLETPGGL